MLSAATLALAASLSTASAAGLLGFNYGSTFTDGSAKSSQDFQNEFNGAKQLAGTTGWTSARLYTMIQANTQNTPISAIEAAIATDTTLLLGLWASAGQDAFNNELAALKAAISTYGDKLAKHTVGLSVGSEDLYRITPTGIAAKSGLGASPDELAKYIGQVRQAISGTALSGVSIGHVDTWTAWVNGSNSAVTKAVDWLGVDAYPYFQSTMANGIENGASLFQAAYDATAGVSGGKPVWITETGWPVSGPASGAAVPSTENAKKYWDAVACPRIGNVNMYWFTLQDAAPTTPSPSFGLLASGSLTAQPLYDLSCKNVQNTTTSASATPSGSSTATAVGPTGTGGLVPSTTNAAGVNGTSSGSGSGSTGSTGGSGSTGSTGGSSGSSGSGSGSGSTGGSGATNSTGSPGTGGSGSGSGAGGATTGSPSAKTSSVPSSGAGALNIGSFGGLFGAILAVIAAL